LVGCLLCECWGGGRTQPPPPPGAHRHHAGLEAGEREPPGVGHYDLDLGERDRAVDNGARPITWRKRERILRKQAAGEAKAP
jgi:hypothetical protein